MAETPTPDPADPGLLRAVLPWVGGALLVVLALILWVWWTAPTPNQLPAVYSVL